MTAPNSLDEWRNAQERETIRALMNAVPALLGYWDLGLRNVLANAAYLDFFGYTPEQMRGRHIREVLGEELFERNYPYMQLALAGKQQLFDREIVDPNGVTRYTQASYVPDIEGGEVQGFFVLVTEITDRRVAEIALAEEKERIDAILNTISDGVVSVAPDLMVTRMNASAAAMTGYPGQIGHVQDVVRLVGGDHLGIAELCEQVVVTGEPVSITDTDHLVGLDGSLMPVDYRITSIPSVSGQSPQLVVALRDVTGTRTVMEQTRYQAEHDQLTGLPNRSYLLALDTSRGVGDGAVLFLDVDSFKVVNDTCGHIVGDAVLCEVAARLASQVRSEDDLVRVGGDEFVVVLGNCDLVHAQAVGQALVSIISRQPFSGGGSAFQLGLSVGVSGHRQADSRSLQIAMEMADYACYQAKKSGGNLVVTAGSDQRAGLHFVPNHPGSRDRTSERSGR